MTRTSQAWAILVLTVLVATAAAGDADKPSHAHGGHGKRARDSAGVTSMDVYAQGDRVHLLVARRDGVDDGHAELQYLRSEDGGERWGEPVRVNLPNQPPPDIAHRGQDVQIAAAGERVVTVWTAEDAKDRFGRGALVVAISSDGGRTWQAGANPADDGKDIGRSFVDVAADEQGVFHLVWLDGRAGKGKGLIYARSTDGGATWSNNQVLVPVTCECCWNTLVAAPGGKLFVLYRAADPRDMALVRSDDGGRTWSTPVTVGGFNWAINGCPHVGGGLAVGSAGALHAFVWTGASERVGAYVLSSEDDGTRWSEPMSMGGGASWHPDVASNARGEVAAVWDAYTDDGTAVLSAFSRDGGRTWTAPTRLSADSASASHPRIFSTPSHGFRAIWTESSGGGATECRSARLSTR